MNEPENYIPITQDDLDDHEKVEKFITIFGRQKYYQAMQELSKQRFGDGTAESIQNAMSRVDINTEKGQKKYASLKGRLADVQSTLKSRKQAKYELPVYEHTADAIFQHREMARNYLGTGRYLEGAFPHANEVVNDQTLRAINPGIREAEQKGKNRMELIQQKEKELSELKNN